MNRQELVRRGYDAIGRRYQEKLTLDPSSPRMRYLNKLLSALRPGRAVLELGCGPGYPVTQALAGRHRIVAVDLSESQLVLARNHAPTATLVQADMTQLHFLPASFDAVAAFYSLTHVPRDRLAVLFARIAEWLRPGGIFLATFGAGDLPGSVEENWLGVPMFFSHFDAATNLQLLEGSGLHVDREDVVSEVEPDGQEIVFLWVVARKSASDPGIRNGSEGVHDPG
jgi:SAM-dependent methyltransferase